MKCKTIYNVKSFECAFCLLLLLLNPIASVSKKTEERPILVLAQDASVSCKDIDDYDNYVKVLENF